MIPNTIVLYDKADNDNNWSDYWNHDLAESHSLSAVTSSLQNLQELVLSCTLKMMTHSHQLGND